MELLELRFIVQLLLVAKSIVLVFLIYARPGSSRSRPLIPVKSPVPPPGSAAGGAHRAAIGSSRHSCRAAGRLRALLSGPLRTVRFLCESAAG
jgi:hypothetical protein